MEGGSERRRMVAVDIVEIDEVAAGSYGPRVT